MPAVKIPTQRNFILEDVDWKSYTNLLRAFAERPSVRLTYDRGTLEIMSPLLGHDRPGWFLGRLVETLTEELGLDIMGGGSTTFRRRSREKGLEADESFWIANERRMRGKDRVNLPADPPPDLAIEVDVTRSSLDRMSIYAALHVPEVWRLDGPRSLSFQALQPDGTYQSVTHSLSFPFVTPADILRFLAMSKRIGANAAIRRFREWIRRQLPDKTSQP
jgi:Uma2 family endonuclease